LTDCDIFGGVAGAFSAVFDADEVVGLIIRARNPSSAGAVVCDKLCLDGCFFRSFGGGPREGLFAALLRVEGFRVRPVFEVTVARLGERVTPD
jgi:hypothetical protein